MKDNSAKGLLEYLYGQLEILGSIDTADTEKVDSACKLNKAVNDTGRTILAVADLSMRAIASTPTLGRRNLLSSFFEDAGADR